MPEVVDEVHRVVYVDGIYVARGLVVLIACSDSWTCYTFLDSQMRDIGR